MLQILHKELSAAVQLLCGDMFAGQVKAMQFQLDKLAQFHVEMKEKLTTKARELSLDILQEQMPRARTWRLSNSGKSW